MFMARRASAERNQPSARLLPKGRAKRRQHPLAGMVRPLRRLVSQDQGRRQAMRPLGIAAERPHGRPGLLVLHLGELAGLPEPIPLPIPQLVAEEVANVIERDARLRECSKPR